MKEIRNRPYAPPPRGSRPTRLVAAAVLHKGCIWTGPRHWRLIAQAVEDVGGVVYQDQQGFWTDDRRFVMRKAGYAIARQSEQLPEQYWNKHIMLSEYLWDSMGQGYPKVDWQTSADSTSASVGEGK